MRYDRHSIEQLLSAHPLSSPSIDIPDPQEQVPEGAHQALVEVQKLPKSTLATLSLKKSARKGDCTRLLIVNIRVFSSAELP